MKKLRDTSERLMNSVSISFDNWEVIKLERNLTEIDMRKCNILDWSE